MAATSEGSIGSLPTEEIAGVLYDRVKEYYTYITANGMLHLWRNSYRQYYKGYFDYGSLRVSGDAREITEISINHYRNLLQHMLVQTTAQRPAFQARALNTDSKSIKQTLLAESILDYYMRQKRVEAYATQAVENGLIYGEGYILLGWDTEAGDVIAPNDRDWETGL